MKSVLEGRPDLKREMDKIAEVAGYLWQKGWAERNGGNIVVNVTDFIDDEIKAMPALTDPCETGIAFPHLAGKWFYCKGTNRRMRDLARDPMDNGSIVRILPGGDKYEMVADKPVVPTSELLSHLAIHNLLAESGSRYKATLHTHPIELVAMSHSPEFHDTEHLTGTLWSMIPETLAFAPLGIAFIPYAMPSSAELADATLEAVRTHDVVMWEKHGTVAVGEDIMDAFDQTDVLNKAACIYMSSRSMGFIPEGLSEEGMQEVQVAFHLPKNRIK